ncbi:Hsp20/alpha crystallin family protein [Paenibacillus sp. OAS669]|uniref:Hsp20/alpha crystallin family protein n=1 Tax=Paenibacillus sp. OAS669 TaxID=2663821 RepID=UPI00178B2C6D|nr:Hsp20/alpha crystallin family protein [Paenibacillus sp. OAS669]MBE1445623.1 HSP20 family protein [Paenibacillus sp. OAS669]
MDKDKTNPMKEVHTFHKQASEVLGEEFWQDIAEMIPKTGPRVDIYHTHTAVVVLAEIPGLSSPDQLGIFLQGQNLVLEGEIPCTYPVTENRITLNERFFGPFRRVLPMPKPVCADRITAKYSRGLLLIELQIEASVQQTQIPIDFT